MTADAGHGKGAPGRGPSGRLRLLWLTEHYPPGRGGMAQSCDRIVDGLRRLGVTVDVAHFTRHLAELRIDVKQAGRVIGVPPGQDPSHGLNLLWSRLEADPLRGSLSHVVGFGGVAPLVAGPVYAAWLGLPLVTLFRGNDFDAAIFAPKRAELVRHAIGRSAAVCVVSRDKQWKIEALHPEVPVVWVPNGIDAESWAPLPSDRRRAEAWRAAHVAPGRRVLGLFGQIKEKKGGLFLLESLLAAGCADRAHLLIVGQLGEEVVAWLGAHAGQIACTLVPFIERYELLWHYLACDLVVIPSFYDGMPNVLLEAAALGIPLVASRAGGMGDLLEDGRHGYLFAPGDTHECRRAIAAAVAAPAQALERLGEACQTLARRHDDRTEARAYLEVFAATAAATTASRRSRGPTASMSVRPAGGERNGRGG